MRTKYVIPEEEMLPGYSDGTIPIPDKFKVTEEDFELLNSFELPKIEIVGPDTLEVGQKAEYLAVVIGGGHDTVVGYQWTCAGTGKNNKTIVDASDRSEGLISICCIVTVQKGDVKLEARGTSGIFIEDVD